MRVAVAFEVDGFDRDLLDRHADRPDDDQLLGLEFIAIRADFKAPEHEPPWYSPQSALGVGQAKSDQKPINVARDNIAKPASQWNGRIKTTDAECGLSRILLQFVRHAQDVGDVVLTIG